MKIKFRGKCAGTWRKGDHLTYANGEVIKQWGGSMSFEYTVEPKTIGQFVGYDTDGNEIYIGDIMRSTSELYDHKVIVGWDEAELSVTAKYLNGWDKGEVVQISKGFFAYYRVIGNIFDNPELFEGGRVV